MDGVTLLLAQAERSRYLGAAGLALTLYDHTLTLSDEVEYVWKAKWTVPKLLFMLVRYAVPCALILQTYQLAAPRRKDTIDTFCQVWFNLAVILGIISVATGNFFVLLRLWALWNRSRQFILYTFPLFLAAQVAVLCCAIIVLVRVTPSLTYDGSLRICIVQQRSLLGALYAPSLMIDGIALVGILWHTGRRSRGERGAFRRCLDEDQFIYILMLFILRAINLATTLWAPLHAVFLVICFVWALTNVTVCRLILDLRRTCTRQLSLTLDHGASQNTPLSSMESSPRCRPSTQASFSTFSTGPIPP